ncbi:MAG: alpha/beta hydrolase [Rhodobacteraceae bacterium CG17_big_fil_post_rev_8_21_14_2_50_63_15]|nr:alpha/beta hydrolase [Roseovarius sp.]PIV78919.1 MAG: alpha/beta hydrolase [Rhodobacteraceae bacterium CG17_big_fil_post_rev_8_21_14_2_50_63_15]
MRAPDYLETPQGRRLAYHQTPGQGPLVVFLGGFRSDMEGVKATQLEHWAGAKGRRFLRFDYSGHGLSSGDFAAGCISDWTADARAVIDRLTTGPLVLVGSSMGGWIALLLARALPERVAGLVTIAAAPDFTEDSIWVGFDERQRADLTETGRVLLPSAYGEPYVITRKLIEDGRSNLVLRDPLPLACPVRFLQGTADIDVNISVAISLLEHVSGPDIRLTLLRGGDHRFSDPGCLGLIVSSVEDVIAAGGAQSDPRGDHQQIGDGDKAQFTRAGEAE